MIVIGDVTPRLSLLLMLVYVRVLEVGILSFRVFYSYPSERSILGPNSDSFGSFLLSYPKIRRLAQVIVETVRG